MELGQVNSLGFSNVTQSNIERLKVSKSLEVDSNSKPLKADKIELQSQTQSVFTSTIMDNVRQISNMSNIQSTVSKQLDITNQIEQSINEVISNPSSGKSLNDIQPKIKNLMDSFNNLSGNISISVNSNEEEKSRVYFDGVLGAKPLSSEEILAEVDSQRTRLKNVNKMANEEVLNTIKKSKEMFDTQKQELEVQKPQIKKFDFAIESSNFEPKKLQNIEGSVIDTQANAKMDQNIKLLAS